jgi:hypothetical protein
MTSGKLAQLATRRTLVRLPMESTSMSKKRARELLGYLGSDILLRGHLGGNMRVS